MTDALLLLTLVLLLLLALLVVALLVVVLVVTTSAEHLDRRGHGKDACQLYASRPEPNQSSTGRRARGANRTHTLEACKQLLGQPEVMRVHPGGLGSRCELGTKKKIGRERGRR